MSVLLAAALLAPAVRDDMAEATDFAVYDICPAVLTGIIALNGNLPLGQMGYKLLDEAEEARATIPGLDAAQGIEKQTPSGTVRVVGYGRKQCVVTLSGKAGTAMRDRLYGEFDAADSGYTREALAAPVAAQDGEVRSYSGEADLDRVMRFVFKTAAAGTPAPVVTVTITKVE